MTNNLFFECIVKSKPRMAFYLKMLLGLVLIFGSFVAVLYIPQFSYLFFIGGAVIIGIFFKERKVEYEYIFTNGSVEVAVVYNLCRRKELYSFEMEQVTMIVPKGSQRISNEQFAKKHDFTSKKRDTKAIALVVDNEKNKQLVVLEQDEKILDYIKTVAKNKMSDF